MRALAWLGRQGTTAIAASVIVGLALPSLGAVLKPILPVAVFVLLTATFLRVDVAEIRSFAGQPRLVIEATLWTSFVVPVAVGSLGRLAGLHTTSPDVFLALMLQAVASPMMASPALALLLGLDAALVLSTMIASTVLLPITAPLLASAFVGPGLTLSPSALSGTLIVLLSSAAVAGAVLRRMIGADAVTRNTEVVSGVSILVLFVFVVAVMDGVSARAIHEPVSTLSVAVLAFAVSLGIFAVTILVFWRAGHAHALAIGLMVSQRNMGVMLAATGATLPDLAWLYFALSQFPVYLAPQILRPVARRVLDNSRGE